MQVGGAERVVAEWAAGFGARRVVTLAYRPESTFDAFRELDVRATIPGHARHAGRADAARRCRRSRRARRCRGGDVALVSSSGWAHRFRFEIPHVVYVHSPARWLYAADDYQLRLSRVRRAGLRMATPLLRRGDLEAMGRARRTRGELRRDARPDPFRLRTRLDRGAPAGRAVAAVAEAPARDLPDGFAVVVARDRGYKNVALAVDAAREARMPIVIVGAGSASLDDPEIGVHGLGRVTDAELCWIYRHAAVIVGAGREDFGLSVLEAALEGTPAAAHAAGGYLETVRPGVNGFLAASETPADLAVAMRRARDLDRRRLPRMGARVRSRRRTSPASLE